MEDYEGSTTIDSPADDLFEYLSTVENLPQYFDRHDVGAQPAR